MGGGILVLSAVTLLAVLGIVVVFVVLPVVVKARCISTAKERGITLTLDHVAIGLGEVRLVKIAFALDGVPQLTARADDAQVTLSGLTPADATVHGLSLTLDGAAEAVQKSLDAWRETQARATSAVDAAAQRKITVSHAHLTWLHAFGQTAVLESTEADGEADAGEGSLHLVADHTTLTAGHATFGPWRTTLERSVQGTRTDVELDPVVPGGPSVVYVRTPAGAVSIRANVAKSPLSRIGIPAKSVGLATDADVEAQIALDEALNGTATMTAGVDLTRAVFSSVPVDLQLRLNAAGDVTKGMNVTQSALRAGPITASVTGTVQLFDDGARLALAWSTRPVPCTEVGKQLATQALGALGAQLGQLAVNAGGLAGLRVTGNALASGLITLDSRDVSAASFTMTGNETCGLALF
ncbi:MAG TPA: hypothetical protein VGI39_37295 [Polyangiaceae bacterium]|jgi:hypothetical protein